MRPELPGFYFDVEKNRYFPIKGPIPGTKSSSSSGTKRKSEPEPVQVATYQKRTKLKAFNLLYSRELKGNVIPANKKKSNFEEEIQKIQASNPVVWSYRSTENISGVALKHLQVDIQTSVGLARKNILVAGNSGGYLSILRVFEAGEAVYDESDTQALNGGIECVPVSVLPRKEREPHWHMWKPACSHLQALSSISSIKLIGSYDESEDVHRANRALITTLGSTGRGSIFFLNLAEEPHIVSPRSLQGNVSSECTIWTADCNISGTHAAIGTKVKEFTSEDVSNLSKELRKKRRGSMVLARSKRHKYESTMEHSLTVPVASNNDGPTIAQMVRQKMKKKYSEGGASEQPGTNLGAALVDLETGKGSYFLRSKSDVLALQFHQSGNIVQCGLRNGAIVSVDLRERPGRPVPRLTRHQIRCQSSSKTGQTTTNKEFFELKGNINPSHVIHMPSSLTCLKTLKTYDQYLMASSMDGTMKLFDQRMVKRGVAVQTYEGNVNSHTRIEFGIDPSERFLTSGGDDCYTRIWSIKSGQLLSQNKFSNSVTSVVCWSAVERKRDWKDSIGKGAWLGSREAIFNVL